MRKLFPLLLLLGTVSLSAASWKAEGPWFGTINCLVIDPSNPERLYAATHGGGVWRSNDGAKTWQLAGTLLANWVVRWVAVHPTTGAVYAGVNGEPNGGVARSTDGGATWQWMEHPHGLALRPGEIAFVPGSAKSFWQADANLHLRSADDGAKWKEFRVEGGDVHAFVFEPGNAKVVWAAGTDGKTGLRRSTDGGTTWTSIGEGLPQPSTVRAVLIDPSNSTRMYLRMANNGFASTDGGETWTAFGGAFPRADVESLVMDPSSPLTLYAGARKGLFKSEDGGVTWEDIDYGLPRYTVRGLAVHPKSPAIVYAGLAGSGVYKSTDGGKSWKPANEGLGASWIERVWADAGGAVFAQASTGLYRRDGDGAWTELRKPFTGSDEVDVDAVVFDRKNPSTIHVADTSSYYRSTDGGKTWLEPAKPFQDPQPIFRGLVVEADGRTLYSADTYADTPLEAVFKSVDGGVKWKAAGNGLPDKSVLVLRGEAAGRLFALTKEHGVWRSTDGAVSWRATGGGLPAKLVDLAIDPAEPNRIAVASEEGLFLSTDGGDSWKSAGKEKRLHAVVIGPVGIFIANHQGVYRSTDGGATWTALKGGLTNSAVRALSIAGSKLYAATAGGGVFSIVVE
jgi:hypothetical protein